MGGFQFNGCGARDYFTKIKFLGNQHCPTCNAVTPFYLEKGSFKASVFWIPTVTLKERYAIMCEKCKEGRWIDETETQRILTSDSYDVNATQKSTPTALCAQCGAALEGAFCGKCGTKNEPVSTPPPISDTRGAKTLCSKCGAVVEGAFCGKCGTKNEPISTPPPIPDTRGAKTLCSKCGAVVEGAFCGKCGTKNEPCSEQEVGQNAFAAPKEWECSLCGTKNPEASNVCRLCGCERQK